jgi:hypothetical protein
VVIGVNYENVFKFYPDEDVKAVEKNTIQKKEYISTKTI